MLWRKYKVLPKAVWYWAVYNIATWLVKLRNRPRKILIHPHWRLRRIAKPVNFKQNRAKRDRIVHQMMNALISVGYGSRLGIAAPQIGINRRVIIVQGMLMFNPEWTPSRAPSEASQEGCYSVPHRTFVVSRAPYGWVKYQDIDGVSREMKLNGLKAIIFQHEFDHLNGKCCADVGEEISHP